MVSDADLTDLVTRLQQGDRRAGDELVRRMEPWVNIRIRRWSGSRYRRSAAHEDLAQEARMGIHRGAMKWRPDGGANAFSYMTLWIDAHVRTYMSKRLALVHLTAAEHHAVSRRAHRGPDGVEADPERRAALERLRPDLSLDAPIGDEFGRATFVDRLEAPGDLADEQLVAAGALDEARLQIERAMGPLTARERLVIRGRLLADPPETLEVVGAQLGVSRERARQLENSGIKKMMTVLGVDYDVVKPALKKHARSRAA